LKTSEPIRAPITTNRPDERHVGGVDRTVGHTEQLDGLGGVLRPAADGEHVAALNRGVRQNRNHGRGGAAHDLPQEDASRLPASSPAPPRVLPSIARLLTRTSTPSTGIASNS
jgi:hypothetical protein